MTFDDEPRDPHGECEAEIGRLTAELERLREAMRELHRIADSGESDIRAIGPVIDRFPELRACAPSR